MIAPSENRAAWEKLVLAGVPSPGTVAITGQKRVIGWDVQAASGQTGATTKRKGEPIGEFDATFFLTDEAAEGGSDFENWDRFESLILSSVEGTDPKALEIIHPDLNRLGFTAVVLGELGELKNDGKGGATITVHFLEYRPPAPKRSTSPRSTNTQETEGDRRIREAEAELNRVVEEGKDL